MLSISMTLNPFYEVHCVVVTIGLLAFFQCLRTIHLRFSKVDGWENFISDDNLVKTSFC